jgi:thioredoxin 1
MFTKMAESSPRFSSLLLLVVFLSSARVTLGEESSNDEDKDIVWLTDAPDAPRPFNPLLRLDEVTFDDAVASKPDGLLVEFFAPWCGTCKQVGPEVQRAAWIAHNLSLPVTIAQVDVDRNVNLTDRYDVTTYPTFLLFADGAVQPFPMLTVGEAYVAGLGKILELGEKADVLPAKAFSDSQELASWLFWRGSNEGKISTSLVFFDPVPGSPNVEDEKARSVFGAVSRELMKNPNLRFAVVRGDPTMADDFDAPTDRATIAIYKDHDEGRVTYSGVMETDNFISWVKKEMIPMVVVVTHKTLQRYRKNVKFLALFFISDAQADSKATVARVLKELSTVAYSLEARGIVERGNFTLGLANGEKYEAWLHYYGLDAENLPAIVIEKPATEDLYADAGGVVEFANAGSCNKDAMVAYRSEMAKIDPEAPVAKVELGARCSAPEIGPNGETLAFKRPHPAEWVAAGEGVLTWVEVPKTMTEAWLEAAINGKVEKVPIGVEAPPKKDSLQEAKEAGVEFEL